MNTARNIIIVGVIVALIAGVGGWFIGTRSTKPQELAPVKFTTGWLLGGGSAAALLAAEEQGYFEQEGVNIDIVRGFGSGDVVTKIASGTYEAGTGFFPTLIQAIAEEPELDATAILIAYDGGPDALVGLKSSGMQTPKDIEGRKISTIPGATPYVLFPAFAEATGIGPDKVEWLEVASELAAVLVQQGEADLTGGFGATMVTKFAKLGIPKDQLVMFKYNDYLDVYYGNALIVRKSWAKENPEATKGLVRAYIKGLIYAYNNPQEAIDALEKREPLIERDIELNDLMMSNEDYYFTENVLQKGIGYHTEEDISKFIHLMAGPMQFAREPAAAEVYDAQYLPPLEERMVQR